jgi:prefoldin subunit 5
MVSTTGKHHHHTLVYLKKKSRETTLRKFMVHFAGQSGADIIGHHGFSGGGEKSGLYAHPSFKILVEHQTMSNPCFYSWIESPGLRGGGMLAAYCKRTKTAVRRTVAESSSGAEEEVLMMPSPPAAAMHRTTTMTGDEAMEASDDDEDDEDVVVETMEEDDREDKEAERRLQQFVAEAVEDDDNDDVELLRGRVDKLTQLLSEMSTKVGTLEAKLQAKETELSVACKEEMTSAADEDGWGAPGGRRGGLSRQERRRASSSSSSSGRLPFNLPEGVSFTPVNEATFQRLVNNNGGSGGGVHPPAAKKKEETKLMSPEELELHFKKYPRVALEVMHANRDRLKAQQEATLLRQKLSRGGSVAQFDAVKLSLANALSSIKDKTRELDECKVDLSAALQELEGATEEIKVRATREAALRREMMLLPGGADVVARLLGTAEWCGASQPEEEEAADDGDEEGGSSAPERERASLTRERNAAMHERNSAVVSLAAATQECEGVKAALATMTQECEGVKAALATMTQECERAKKDSTAIVCTLRTSLAAVTLERDSIRREHAAVEEDHAAVVRQKEQMHQLALANARNEFRVKVADLERQLAAIAPGGGGGGGEAVVVAAPRGGGGGRRGGGRRGGGGAGH